MIGCRLRVLLALLIVPTAFTVFAQQKAPVPGGPLPDDPQSAWAEVTDVHQALQPPPDWRTRTPTAEEVASFQKLVTETSRLFAAKAREFISRYPTNENVGEARIIIVHALTHAVAAGDVDAEREIQEFTQATLSDLTLPEDDRVGVLLYSGNAAFMKKAGMRLFTEGLRSMDEQFETHSIEVMRSALKQFPTSSFIHTMLIGIAQRSKPDRQQELARLVQDSPGAPPGAKALAEHLLKGTKPYQLGKPVDIRFTALDGREVDLAKLKGKVVLIDFWSTSCGPCIAEMPGLKAAYEKFHPRGFEVIGISLDDKESVLRKFITQKQLPWPQHFDGKGWENQFAVRYGIFGIPTVWLVDKRGNLRTVEARGDLEQRIERLLAEK